MLLFVSALLSGSEVSFFSLSQGKLDDRKRSDRLIRKLLSRPLRLLATILILNNLANLSIIMLVVYLTYRATGKLVEELPVVALMSGITTLVIVLFGEITPKIYASGYPLKFSRITSAFLFRLDKGLAPFTWMLLRLNLVIERTMNINDSSPTIEELHQAVDIVVEKEQDRTEEGILRGLINFNALTVKQIMQSRMDIFALERGLDFRTLMHKIREQNFSRIPVYHQNIDQIEGILHVKDLLPHLEKERHFKWRTLLASVYYVPRSKKLKDLLRDFQNQHTHLAIVVDEYGGTEGVITLQDIMDEIVGDETRGIAIGSPKGSGESPGKTFRFEAKTSLHDFCKTTGIQPALFESIKGDSESLGGVLLEINKQLPEVGSRIRLENLVFTILSADKKRIKKVDVLVG